MLHVLLLLTAALLIGVTVYFIRRCYVIAQNNGFKDCDGTVNGIVTSIKKGKRSFEVEIAYFRQSADGAVQSKKKFIVHFPLVGDLPKLEEYVSVDVAMRTYPLRKFFDKYVLWMKQWKRIEWEELRIMKPATPIRVESVGSECVIIYFAIIKKEALIEAQ